MDGRKAGKPVLAGILVAHVAVTAITWRDLSYRQPEQVRGTKRFWQVASGVNTLGSLAYYLVGRKQGALVPH